MSADAVRAFLEAATSGACTRARRLLEQDPGIAEDPWAALVLGHSLVDDPVAPGGPLGWAPLLYVAHSCFASVDLARKLLARGADPNATFTNEYGEMSALYGAAGVVHDAALTRLLLEAGADPDDGESLYHSTEAPTTDCLRVLLEHGASPAHTNALAHAIDTTAVEPVRLLLEHGADPNEGDSALLVHAVRRGCGEELLVLLLEHGAELDRRGGEWSTPPEQYRTAYQNAALRGRDDLTTLLADRGADTTVSTEDRAVAAVARGEPSATALPAELDADAQEALIQAVLAGRVDPVVDVLGASYFGHNGGGPPGTLLHFAAWDGNAAVVGQLLARGADPVAEAPVQYATPVAWAALGSGQPPAPGRDHVAVVEALVSAGAVLEPRFADVAGGALAEWLAGRV